MTDWPQNMAFLGIVTATVLFLVFAFKPVEKPQPASVRVRRRQPTPPQHPGGKRE